jgi:hypothetical protein
MENSKIYIEILILVFMFVTSCLCSLFSLYYISPSNYVLYDFKENNKRTLTKEYTIQPNKQKKIKMTKYPNRVFRIYSDKLDYVTITLENAFKSENVYVTKNNLIKLSNSNLIIKNNQNDPIKVILEIYSFIGI